MVSLATLTGCGGKTLWLGRLPAADDGGRAEVGGDGIPSDAIPDGANCVRGQVKANEVLWIGDTWITIPGTQHTRVRDLARIANAIGPTEDYNIQAAGFSTMAAITDQYNRQAASATKPRVVIMDGGTYETITGNGSDASVATAASGFRELLTKVASDGLVGHVIYFLCPEAPGIYGVAALRPLVQQACAESAVPCHFLDLQPLWAGHPEYSSSIQASEAGALVIAESIWKIMQDNCIAQ